MDGSVVEIDATPRRDGTTTIDGWRTSDARRTRWYSWDDDDDGGGIGHARSVRTRTMWCAVEAMRGR